MGRQYKRIKQFISVLLLFTAIFFFTRASMAAYTPQDLYDEVWKLINSRYVDADKNGQDWQIWRHRYDDKIQTEQDAYVAIKSMLASLNDRYTRFLDPQEFAEEGMSIRASLYGIGIQIGSKDGKVVVIAPIEGTPAEKAGLKAQDVILKIDGKSADGMSVKEAADLIRGEKGTKVDLLVKRGENPAKLYSIMRDEIKLKSVSIDPPVPVKPNIGYIRLSTFLSKKASSEFKDALDKEGQKDGYILDLRGNPGGLLTNAITIADDFLDNGAIVSTVDRDGYKQTKESSPGVITSKPLVVLINEGSASASEILSGALRDNNRAILVGKKSFGKGLVQEINSLPDGAGVNITTQKYLTPNDTDINKVGIVPDVDVEMPEMKPDQIYDPKKDGDPQLKKGEEVLEELIAGKNPKMIQSRSLVQQKKDTDVNKKSASTK